QSVYREGGAWGLRGREAVGSAAFPSEPQAQGKETPYEDTFSRRRFGSRVRSAPCRSWREAQSEAFRVRGDAGHAVLPWIGRIRSPDQGQGERCDDRVDA